MSQKTFWHIGCLNKLLKSILNFALAWKKVNRFYFSFGVTRVGNHINYSSRGRLFHTGKDRLSLEQDFCVIKSFIVLVLQVYSPLYKEYILTNFSISFPSYSHYGAEFAFEMSLVLSFSLYLCQYLREKPLIMKNRSRRRYDSCTQRCPFEGWVVK